MTLVPMDLSAVRLSAPSLLDRSAILQLKDAVPINASFNLPDSSAEQVKILDATKLRPVLELQPIAQPMKRNPMGLPVVQMIYLVLLESVLQEIYSVNNKVLELL